MKLSNEAVEQLLIIISRFDRLRGIPHNYTDLGATLKTLDIEARDNNLYLTTFPKEEKS